MGNFYDTNAVKASSRGRWFDIVSTLTAGEFDEAIKKAGKGHVYCPFHQSDRKGKPDFRFAPRGAGNEYGSAICSCGKWSDGFELLMKFNGWSFVDAKVHIAESLGMTPADGKDDGESLKRQQAAAAKAAKAAEQRRQEQHAIALKEAERIIEANKRLYLSTVPIDVPEAEPARAYLERRGLGLAIPNLGKTAVRFHPNLSYYDEDGCKVAELPAIVMPVIQPSGQGATVHRIFLTPDGDKAPVPNPKKLGSVPATRPLDGAAIRLFRLDGSGYLGIAEGPETAIASSLGMGNLPVWSAISATMMECFEPPAEIHTVFIFADKDRSKAGHRAAKALAARLTEKGIMAMTVFPALPIPENGKSVDWADVWQTQGVLGFPNIFMASQLPKSVMS